MCYNWILTVICLFQQVIQYSNGKLRMGLGQSSHVSHNYSGNLLVSLIPVRKLSQSKTLCRSSQSSELFVTLERMFACNEQLQHFLNQSSKKCKIDKESHFICAVESFRMTNSNICSKQHKIVQIYPYEGHTLWQEVQNRLMNGDGKKHFQVREVWSILCTCVLAMGHANRNEILHYTLNPHDLVLDAMGKLKIIPLQLSQFQFDYSLRKQYYYAPQMLKAMKVASHFSPNNQCGVYTLAITILHLIDLKPMNYLYDFQEMSIDQHLLNQRVQMILDRDLREVMRKMIKPAVYQRINFTELEEMLYRMLERRNTEQKNQERPQDSICTITSQQQDNQQQHRSTYYWQFNHNKIIQQNNNQSHKVSTDCLNKDAEDQPFSQDNEELSLGIDYQKIDQQGETSKFPEPTHMQAQAKNIFLADRSNTHHNNLNSLKFQFKKHTIQETRSQNIEPYYVTEQYNRGRYEGYKLSNMRHGFGTFYYLQGGRYTGEWFRNKMEGRGALYYTCGNLAYEGQWKKDQLHGYGVLYNESPKYFQHEFDYRNLDRVEECWVKYEGEFKEDLRHGEGRLNLANGESFVGQFMSDLPDGEGIFKTLNGEIVRGQWNRGCL